MIGPLNHKPNCLCQNLNFLPMHLRLSALLILLPLCALAVTNKALTDACLCDISDSCDFECCCDPECETIVVEELDKYGKCSDDGFGIPYCAGLNETDIHPDDLYSGLSTIYAVIRRLFCLQRVNIVKPNEFYLSTVSSSTITQILADQTAKTNAVSVIPSDIASLSKVTIAGLIFANSAGLCYERGQINSNEAVERQSCQVKLSYGSIGTDSFLSINTLQTTFGNRLKVYLMNEPTSSSPNDQSGSSPATSCSGSTCYNLVRYLKLYITQDGQINSDYSYALISDLEVQSGSYVKLEYSYKFLNGNGGFPKNSNVGYLKGTPLILLKSEVSNGQTTYYRVQNPINLAFRKTDGSSCRTQTTDGSDNSLVALEFGRNQFYTCYGDSSLIYTNLKSSFDLVGTLGLAGTSLGDYTAISWPSITDTKLSILLNVYYLKVGAAESPQYYVVNVTAQSKSTINNQQTLYIQYQEVENSASMYIPPPPRVHAYLPNDFLYPFYVAS